VSSSNGTPPDEPEVVDGLPVLASDPSVHGDATPLQRGGAAGLAVLPSRQVAALATAGFAAGAATVALVHRHRSKSVRRGLTRRKNGRSALGEVVSSGSFLVDVHVLRRD
jgi:hypothetical protein